MAPAASVVIATRDRPAKLEETIARFGRQTLLSAEYEVVVVDDGSIPPVAPRQENGGPLCRTLHVEARGRSAARNAGAAVASGTLLVFVDDDVTVGPDFLEAHLSAQQEWPGALAAGAIRLSPGATTTPFGRFRQRLEDGGVPQLRGPAPRPNFCAAGNMSIPRRLFEELAGFDPGLASAEDQDLALRHTARGGRIIFIPEAAALHRDDALDIRSYCRRMEWGAETLVPFCRRHPGWPDNQERETINGPVRLGRESLRLTAGKLLKDVVGLEPAQEVLFVLVRFLERRDVGDRVLDLFYRLLLGIHIRRGYLRGSRRFRRSLSPHLRGTASEPDGA